MRVPKSGELAWNPVTSERCIVLEGPGENPQRRLEVELHVEPGGAVVGEHLHPAIDERFEVMEGKLGVKLADGRSEAGPGQAVEVPAGPGTTGGTPAMERPWSRSPSPPVTASRR